MSDENDAPRELERTFELDPPVVWSGGTVDSITLHAPKVREIQKAMQNVDFNTTQGMTKFAAQFVEAVSGKPRVVIDELQYTQMREMTDWLMPFFTGAPVT